jgi:branched-chain amino acid transport system substrate-binding protein
MSDSQLKRDSFLKLVGAAGVALTAGAPAFIPQRAAGADTLKIGVIDDFTGVYATPARDQSRGFQMVADEWNKKGGLLGRQIQLVSEDTNNNPGIAVEKARKLINEDKVVALIGTVNSAVSVAVTNVAFELSTPFIDAGGHTDAINGSSCHWTTYRTCHSTWMETHATGLSIAKLYGKKWYYIAPDYAYGHALLDGYRDIEKKLGITVVGTDLTPLGTADFSAYLTKVLSAAPSCLLLMVQGDDLTNALKQANSMGLSKRIPIAGPQAELETFWPLPPEARVGSFGFEWYYKSDLVLGKNAYAHDFVKRFMAQYKEPPPARVAFGYISANRLAAAIQEANTTDAVKVAKAIAGVRFNALTASDDSYYRPADHQLMWPMWFGNVRAAGTPGDPMDIFDITDVQPAEAIERTVEEQSTICKMAFPS